MYKILQNKLIGAIFITNVSRRCSQVAARVKDANRQLLISCKRKKYNFYSGTVYNKFEEVDLASKGWNHNKSKGDYFVVHPNLEEYVEELKPFDEICAYPQMLEALKKMGIVKATEFQCEAITAVRTGNPTLLAAETGCGKTIAYLIPIVESLTKSKQTQMNVPTALVIVPNRELALQIGEVAKQLCEPFDLNVKVVVGGNSKQLMMNPEFSEIDILVGTPGVLSKLSTVGIYKFHEIRIVVLDEADTLMDDSFEERVSTLLKRVPKSQIVLVSATYPKRLVDILYPLQNNFVDVTSPRLHKPLLKATQKFIRIARSNKPAELLTIAKHMKQPLLVFSNKNETCDWLAMFLRENGLPCSNVNGSMHRLIRIKQWEDFVNGETRILSATDVGSRGLDTTQVSHVVNYDFPVYMADYIHRIGRTGRFGSPQLCKITNFICGPRSVELVQQIELAIRKNQPLPDVDGNTTSIFQKHILKEIRKQSVLNEDFGD